MILNYQTYSQLNLKNKNISEGTNYLFKKLNLVKSYYLIQLLYKYNIPIGNLYMSMPDYYYNLGFLLEAFKSDHTMEEEIILKLVLYKLLCDTFWTKSNEPTDLKNI